MTTKIKSASLDNNIITTSHLHTNFSLDSDKIADDAVTDDKINLTGTGALQLPDGTTAQRPGSPSTGQLRFSTSKFQMEVYDGNNWVLSSTVPSYTAEFLVVAGGGGGGYSPSGTWRGGGGGAGGLRTSFGSTSGGGASAESDITLVSGTTYAVVVGAGGAGGSSSSGTAPNGGTSSFIGGDVSISTVGGRGGANYGPRGGASGGSGGGASGGSGATSSGTANQGFAGGSGNPHGYAAGAGGGAGSAASGGTKGTGLSISITGSAVTYAVGGHSYWDNVQQSGNDGNGGEGRANGAGNGENGNPGVVIIRYSGSQRGTGGTVTTAGSDTVHTFTSNGNFVA